MGSLFEVTVIKQQPLGFLLQFVSFMTISFLCVSAYFTIFRIRLLNYYYLASHHMTNEYSLIFAGM